MTRVDVGMVTNRGLMPFTEINLLAGSGEDALLDVTIGDLMCSRRHISENPSKNFFTKKLFYMQVHCIFTDLDECEMGFHDCAEEAVCINSWSSFNCECVLGFNGKIIRNEAIAFSQ